MRAYPINAQPRLRQYRNHQGVDSSLIPTGFRMLYSDENPHTKAATLYIWGKSSKEYKHVEITKV